MLEKHYNEQNNVSKILFWHCLAIVNLNWGQRSNSICFELINENITFISKIER